jgi:DNA invertase Pin-like site-specific DNA recombinase
MPRKRFIGFARVSSSEQAVEGHSLETQEEAIRAYAERNGGKLIRFWRIVDTASKRQKRTAFQEIVSFAEKHARQLDGVLFFEIDRATRNLKDALALEQFESDLNVPFISVNEPEKTNAASRMLRSILCAVSRYVCEEHADAVRRGLARHAEKRALNRSASKARKTPK